jgi:hypothetical protein
MWSSCQRSSRIFDVTALSRAEDTNHIILWRRLSAQPFDRVMAVLRFLCSAILLMSLLARATAANGFVDFNIPAAPLEDALGSFGRVTKEQLLLDALMLDGRRSTSVIGRFTPEAALRQILVGTGLTVRSIEGQGYAVVDVNAEAHRRRLEPSSRFDSYSALLQTALGKALCSRSDTMPGHYRTMVQLVVGASGAIDHVELLTSSGDLARDGRLTERLRGLAIGAPPPGLPQPITLLVTSEGASPAYCTQFGRSSDAVPSLR